MWFLAFEFVAASCDSGKVASPGRPTVHGNPDQAANEQISIDESGITGQALAAVLSLQIPATNLTDGTVQGKVAVAVSTVDNTGDLTRVEYGYKLTARQVAAFSVPVPIPAGITDPADWVKYNLRITGAGGLHIKRSLLAVVPGMDVRLEGPATLTRGRKVSYRVRAQDPVSYRTVPGVPVELQVRKGQEVVQRLTATTSVRGDAVFDLVLPEDGNFEVYAQAASQTTVSAVRAMAEVEAPGARVLLTTDKPIYQPGQTIHLRAMALSRGQNTAIAAQPVTFGIADAKGNKIFKKDVATDGHGIASHTFKLGRFVNMGNFKVSAALAAAETEKTVLVSRYVLPKFKIAVKADAPFYLPGQTITGTVDARYFFGKAVNGGDVTIEAASLDVGETVFARVMGKTDGNGLFAYSLTLPGTLVGLPLDQGNALVNLRVTVLDTAGQQVVQEKPVTVAAAAIRVAVVPESNLIVPGVINALEVFVTDPVGAPIAGAPVSIAIQTDAGQPTIVPVLVAATDAFGQAQVSFTPPSGAGKLRAAFTVSKPGGASPVSGHVDFTAQSGQTHLMVRSDKAVYNVGETATIDVIASGPAATAYVDVINRGQTVDMRTLAIEAGAARFQVPVTPDLSGDSRIEAYVVDSDGQVVRAGRTVFARASGSLTVELATDKQQYLPGTPAMLTFSVKDEAGHPTPAALGVQVVDEAVFAVIDARPGLLRTFFELEESFAEPHYQIRPPLVNLNNLLFEETAGPDTPAVQAAQRRAVATFSALGDTGVMGIQKGSWGELFPAISQRLAPALNIQEVALRATISKLVVDGIKRLEASGCKADQYSCQGVNKPFLTLLQEDVKAHLEAFDFWGNRFQNMTTGFPNFIVLEGSGPDEKAGNKDDVRFMFKAEDLDVPVQFDGVLLGNIGNDRADFDNVQPGNAGPPENTGGAGANSGQGGKSAGEDETGDSPRVRQDFPETLYVNPALITGADGKATVRVDMADSITEWRVSTLAHSPTGKLGGGVAGVTVFQEFFVDVNFPATLTRGDEVAFPVTVYNYLETPQKVTVSLQPESWYTAMGATTTEVQLAAGEVTGIRFPVRVDRVGRQTLTVVGFGSSRSDAVARSVLVEPDGQMVPVARSGSLGTGQVKHTVNFPADAVPGSQEMFVNIYPAFLSQVVEGMDSMLQVPNGCFEQTTSTAWPNVLVTDYLKRTNQITPEIQLKAETLMSAGYQRLLTFEHPGGGFSWFGTQDQAPFLSVTAFGLMEFADMAKVHTVDMAMLARTRDWLVAQQKSDGSWEGDQSEFFTFHTSAVRNTAFVIWALAAASYQGEALGRGLAFVKANMNMQATDAYTLGILANAFAAAAPSDPVTSQLMTKLEESKQADGDMFFWDSGGTQTNFYGSGDEAKVTATALAAHALLTGNAAKTTVDGALKFLTSKRDTLGNFGSTQATIWTLRTLLLAASKGTDGAVGTVTISVDGQPFRTLMLTPDQFDVMTTVDLAGMSGALSAGAHEVGLQFAGTGKVSYNVVSSHNVPWGATQPTQGPLSITLAYDKAQLPLDAIATAKVAITNNTANKQNMILVTLGLPPGFQVQTEDLDAYVAAKQLSQYEMTGKQLILYVTELPAAATLSFAYRLRATMPVRAADGGAEVALYYEPTKKAVAKATTLIVQGP